MRKQCVPGRPSIAVRPGDEANCWLVVDFFIAKQTSLHPFDFVRNLFHLLVCILFFIIRENFEALPKSIIGKFKSIIGSSLWVGLVVRGSASRATNFTYYEKKDTNK